MFYGVRPAWRHLWDQAKAEGRDWYYADNGYFPVGIDGGQYFRVARNAVQAIAPGWTLADGARRSWAFGFASSVSPWRQDGRTVLVCLQSDEFMATVAGTAIDLALEAGRHTDRPIVVRRKGDATPIAAALADAWCVVTWSSNCAIDAICAGVPAIVLGQSAAVPMAGTRLEQIEDPPRPDGREAWVGRLAASQWTLDEMARGDCWRALHG
ncbi:hypothetical protein [Inquilinus sp. CA228]|uniref:hypothetical protein n=1 Tax=Inquilinus sp. CA228 TaxID=3455609 RepID=UPI003F8D5CFB